MRERIYALQSVRRTLGWSLYAAFVRLVVYLASHHTVVLDPQIRNLRRGMRRRRAEGEVKWRPTMLEENRVRMRRVCEVEWLDQRGVFRDGRKLG